MPTTQSSGLDEGSGRLLLGEPLHLAKQKGIKARSVEFVFTSFINYSEPVLPFQTTTDTPLLLRSQGLATLHVYSTLQHDAAELIFYPPT
jgi:hypothetical protein